MNKIDKFIYWLCGKGEFPFFKEVKEVPPPTTIPLRNEIREIRCLSGCEIDEPTDDLSLHPYYIEEIKEPEITDAEAESLALTDEQENPELYRQ